MCFKQVDDVTTMFMYRTQMMARYSGIARNYRRN